LKYLRRSKRTNVRPLNRDELAHISEIDVTEDGDLIYRNIDGGLVVESKTWHRPRWDAGECQRRIAEFLVEMDRGDTVLGAFDGDRLVGAASLCYQLSEDMAQLVSLHVSQSHRRRGVATTLTDEIIRLAQDSGARRIYVSATPSASAVGFYRSKGFELAEQVNEELFALEPEDIHMIRGVPFPQNRLTQKIEEITWMFALTTVKSGTNKWNTATRGRCRSARR
jgi:ribosomal protein S18 acetylase RimI-like enzyme